jgi:hypothetical protein
MCRGPLAYGHATATRIRCGVRFGEVLLRVDRGLGHLTEDVFAQLASHPDRFSSQPTHDSGGQEGKPRKSEPEQPGPRAIVTARRRPRDATTRRGRSRPRRDRGAHALNRRLRLLRVRRARPMGRRDLRSHGATRGSRNRSARPPHRSCRLGRARARRRCRRRRGPRPRESNLRRRPRSRSWRHRRPRGGARRRLGLLGRGTRRLGRARLGPRRRVGRSALPGRKQGQRVEIPVRLGREPYSQVDRGNTPFVTAELSRRDHVLFGDRRACAHRERAEVQERDRVAVFRPQRDRPAAAGNRAREGDHARDRSEHVLSRRGRDFDAAVLSGSVRVAVEVEGPQHRPGDGPAPCRRGGRRDQGPGDRRQGRPGPASVVSPENHAVTVSGPSAVVKIVYSEPR